MDIRLKNDLIMLSTADWDEPNWTNKQHIAMQFYQMGFRVLYVEPPIFIGRYLINLVKKMKGQNWLNKLKIIRHPYKNFYIISQFYIFPARCEKINYYFGSLLNIIFIKLITFLLKFKKPYLINYLPFGGEYIGKFCESSSIYDCVDEYSGMTNIMKDIKFYEIKLMRRVKGITVTARGLLPLKKKYNKNTILAHNVGNTHLFLYENLINCKKPEELLPFKDKKIIGFIGAINFKIDIELLEELLDKFKKEEFVFIGPIYQFSLKKFEKYNNIHFLGTKTLEKLPCFVRYFNVGIIPYKLDAYTKFVFPLKLFEFFAAKIPVVSIALPEINYYSNIAYVARDKDEFIEAVKNILNGNDDKKRVEIGYELARNNNWSIRAQKIYKILRRGENKK